MRPQSSIVSRDVGRDRAQITRLEQQRVWVRNENLQGYDELMKMAIRHAQADHDTYEGTSVEKKKVEGREGGSPVQVVQEVRA